MKRKRRLSLFDLPLLGLILALICLSGLFSPAYAPVSAVAGEAYGLIKENALFLDAEKNPLTSLPASYFVIIKGEDGAYFNAEYGNLSGFIAKEFVEVVDYEPKTKFHTAYFTAKNDTFPTNVRLAPSSASSVAVAVPLNQKAYLYGTLEGEALISSAGATWFYVEYDGVAGYAYCAHGTAATIPINIIEKVEVPPIDLTPPENSPVKLEWVYVLLVTIPAVVIMLTLFSRPKKDSNKESGLF